MSDESNNTDPVRALIEQWRNSAENGVFTGGAGPDIRETLMECADELEAALASAPPSAPDRMAIRMLVAAGFVTDAKANEALQIAHGFISGPLEPPSAPEGVEWNDEAAWSLAARAEAAGAERDSDDNGTWWTLRIEHFNALSQQPAAPSGEAVAWMDPNTLDVVHTQRKVTWMESFGAGGKSKAATYTTPLYTAPQQPAAVDDAAALDDFTAYFVKNYPGPNTIIGDPKWHAPRIFRAAQRALAAQQHGGRADG